MKFLRFVTPVFLFISSSTLSTAALERAVGNYPSFTELVEHFFTEYRAPKELTTDRLVKFSRKKDGWHVYVTDMNNTSVLADEVIWSGKYKELKYFVHRKDRKRETGTFAKHQDKPHHLTPDHIRQFKIHTFFGYKGWAEDVIKELEPHKSKLNDDDLYSLGRAYGAVNGSITHRVPDAIKNQPEKPESGFKLEGETLKKYMKYHDKAEGTFKMLADRNPHFWDIVGKIQTKYANEVVQAFLDLWMYGDEMLAREQLLPNIYPVEVITNAKNYLMNCPPNAILITYGDNDTYPLWYVQLTEGYRSDVTVVNTSLLNIPEYIKGLNTGFNGRAVAFSIAHESYNKLQYITLSGDSLKTISSEDFVSFVDKNAGNGVIQTDKFMAINVPFKSGNGTLRIPQTKFMITGDVALADLCITNFRPIAFSQPDHSKRMFVASDFEFRGIVYELKVREDMHDFNHDAIDLCIQTLLTDGYSDESNFPKKEDGSFINPAFINHLYNTWPIAFGTSGDAAQLRTYKKFWEKYSSEWVIKPSRDASTYVEQLGN